MTIQSDQNRHPGFLQSGQLTLLRRGDNRAPHFRVELRALEPACLVCFAINVLHSAKADTAHGLTAVHA
jgi:hypothetical protein